ncbi:MAG: dTMP kinase [Spirochaetes bacterium GWE1_32_154]|nr:MAG: dTMP kinase [Spirochaetes bacterium GWE1_32_154]
MNILNNFIVIEGIDGAGTTTQCKLLNAGIKNSVFTCEPTPGVIGKMIREILSGSVKVDKHTLALLFASDRSDHMYGVNGISKISDAHTIICDRYILSSYAYQSLDVDDDFIISINSSFPIPAITFFIDTDVEECCRRVDTRKEKEIYEIKELQYKIREKYRIGIQKFKSIGHTIIEIDGNKSVEEINEDILSFFKINQFPVDKRGEII